MTGKTVFARLPYEIQREICVAMIAKEQEWLSELGHEGHVSPAESPDTA
jgi:ATP-dependent Clp protease ATP-binding subunit ClpB